MKVKTTLAMLFTFLGNDDISCELVQLLIHSRHVRCVFMPSLVLPLLPAKHPVYAFRNIKLHERRVCKDVCVCPCPAT